MTGWVFFRADSLPAAVAFLKALAGVTAQSTTPYTIRWFLTPELGAALAAGIIGSMPIVPTLAAWRARVNEQGGRVGLTTGADLAGATALVMLLVASIMQIAARTYNPFIYFRF
jgi:alginate O-acetyltransferase complex protein AlgI